MDRMNRKNVEDLYPLSPLQQGMLFHTLYSPGTGAYLAQQGMNLLGSVDVDAFRAAWQRVVDRHPVLRTGVVWEGVPQPLQVVFRQVELPFIYQDWSGVDAAEREHRYHRELEDERRAGLELVKAPLMRVRLYRFGPAEWRFALTTHHLLLDGWSFPIVLAEFGALYAGLLEGVEPELPPRPPFRHYITWLNRQDAGAAEAFWRARLAGFTTPTPLPLDRAPRRAGAPAERHATAGITLPADAAEAIEAAARRLRVTANALFQCAWARVLSAWTGETDVVFGATVSGRPPELPGVDEMVGMFINAIPVRIRVPAGASVAEWVRAAHAAQAQARAFEHAPLASVRGWSGVPGDAPLFETLFVYENFPLDALQSGAGDALQLAPDEVPDDGFRFAGGHGDERTNYPLSVVVAPGAHGFRVTATYDPERLDHDAAETLLRGVERVLAGIAADAEQPAAVVSPLSTGEVERVVRGFNRTEADYPRHASIHALFAEAAAAHADAPAIVADGVRWTYAEVDARANRLARRLRELGVGVESRVGVSLERSPELVVALLAILKAGGAYVPLDPAYPAPRRARMAADAGVARVLVEGDSTDDWGEGIRAVDLAAERERIGALPADGPGVAVDAENLAYVIFTSGSTGVPKGVAVPHRAVVRLVRGQAYARFGPASVFLQLAPVAFDASTFEVWGALLNGGAVAVHPPSIPEPGELGAFAGRHGVTTMWLTAGLFHQVVDAGAPGLEGVREILAGGDVVSAAHVLRAMEALPSTRFVNGYGPTESTTFACCHPVRRQDAESGTLPVGAPVANTRAYVLDHAMRPAPAGAPGELYLCGDGLARGYLGRAALTAERFVPDPFGRGGRLYRTGDRARWNGRGQVEFLGRADRQVKVRGYRIEPGEVEAALLAHPSVRAAVVDARGGGAGGKRLAAYLVPVEGAAPDAAELREHLSRSLPEYMLPSAFVVLPGLPLTPNGKVDRARLPDPDAAVSTAQFVSPRGETELALAGIWREVLNLEAAGAGDHFFLLGGHSLLAMQVVSRIRAAFAIDLPMRAIFEHPTLRAMAAEIDSLRAGTPSADPPAAAASTSPEAPSLGPTLRGDAGAGEPIVRVPRDGPLPVSFAQERMWFLQQLDPAASLYSIPAPLRIRGRLEVDALRRSVAGIVRRHEPLRTVFARVDGRPVQRVLPSLEVDLPLYELSDFSEDEAEREARRRAVEDAAMPFDLERGPLFRVSLLRLADDDHVLLWNVHHAVFDGWSYNLLRRELVALYDAFSAGRPSPLPELEAQYADYAAWQRRWLTDERMRRQVAYWTEELAGAPPALELPTDRPRPAVQRHRGASETALLPPELHQAVHAMAAGQGATMAMALLAAFQLVLGRWAGQDDVVVGTPIAGRTRPETEAMIGLFLNTLAIRTRLPGGESFTQLLRRVRETMLGAYAHQDVPFERLLEELHPERSLSRTPVFQVMFNLLNLEGAFAGAAAPGESPLLRAEPFAGALDTGSKFDLTLYAQELPDGIALHATYDADLFGRPRIAALLGQIGHVLRQASRNPGVTLNDLSLLTGDDASVLPDPAAPLATRWFGPVHAMVSARAAERPDAPAIVDADGGWTYARVDAASNRIARLLRERGVRAGDVVAVYVHRSAWLPVSLLGISKAGAAWLLLDPAYPAARLAERVEIARPRALLRVDAAGPLPAELREAIEARSPAPALALTSDPAHPDAALLAAVPADAVDVDVGPDDLAYLAFTSGTTGRAKAIAGTHRPLSHFFRWYADTFGAGPADRFTLLSGLGHDPLLRDVFAPLTSGGALHVPDAARIGEPGWLAGWFARHAITVTHLTPAMGQILSSGVDAHLPSLRLAMFGGDVLRGRDVDRLRSLAPSARVVNAYGATETPQVMSIYHVPNEMEHAPDGSNLPQAVFGGGRRFDDSGTVVESLGGGHRRAVAESPSGGPLPVGRGIDGVQLLVLNAAGRLAGTGELGEVAIRTPYLARGYANDAQLTAARFRPNPATGDPSDRLYLTGDLGRYRPGGVVEIAGRADRQLQIRGFRVEPAEVEAAIAAHPAVRGVAVVPLRDAGGEPRLVAYVVADGRTDPAAELRAWLTGRLPDFMVPSAFVRMDALPLTANGKLDVGALPDPEPAAAAGYVAPRTAAEQVLAELWAEVLRLERVGVDDNFFALGGHSLLATQVLSRVDQAFGVTLPVRALFEHPTVATLAAAIEATGTGVLAEPLADLEALSDDELAALLAEVEGAEGD